MRTFQRRRGATLVVAITITAVLTVIAAGMIRRGSAEMESATAKRHYDTSVSCAEGAREMLMSQFRAYGIDVSALTLDQKVGPRRFSTGHYDTFGVKSVVPVDKSQVGAGTDAAMDLSNRSVKIALGGAFYRVTVVCSDAQDAAGSRASEVEFLIRFGL